MVPPVQLAVAGIMKISPQASTPPPVLVVMVPPLIVNEPEFFISNAARSTSHPGSPSLLCPFITTSPPLCSQTSEPIICLFCRLICPSTVSKPPLIVIVGRPSGAYNKLLYLLPAPSIAPTYNLPLSSITICPYKFKQTASVPSATTTLPETTDKQPSPRTSKSAFLVKYITSSWFSKSTSNVPLVNVIK